MTERCAFDLGASSDHDCVIASSLYDSQENADSFIEEEVVVLILEIAQVVVHCALYLSH